MSKPKGLHAQFTYRTDRLTLTRLFTGAKVPPAETPQKVPQ